jgi:ATP-binding cassette subfamily C (CFTR/MRP) protein 1
MVSVERIQAYTAIPIEADWTIRETDESLLSNQWPTKGTLVFDQVHLRYRPGLPYVLENVSFHVHAGQKVMSHVDIFMRMMMKRMRMMEGEGR